MTAPEDTGAPAGHAPPPVRSARRPHHRSEWLAWVDDWSAPAIHLVSAILVLVVALLDRATGTALGFLPFYLIPVSLAAWRLGRRAGLAWAAIAAVIWLGFHTADTPQFASAVHYWNGAAAFVTFAVVALSLAAVRRLREAEWMLAGTDSLTGALNGPAFHDLVDLERSRALRYNRPFTLAYVDVDRFRAVNDRFGHSRGDAALRLIATTITEHIRSMDTVARLGGDEFGLLFPETGPGAAEVALRKIQHHLGAAMAAESLDLTFSIGAVICVGPPDSVDSLIQRADALMYEVKQSGRNDLKSVVLDENYGIEAILGRMKDEG